MSQEATLSKVIFATKFNGETTGYEVELCLKRLEDDNKYQIMTYVLKEPLSTKILFHDLEKEKIIYSVNEIKKLTHGEKNIRPIVIDKIDVYNIVYELKNGWVEECNIPCDLIIDTINKLNPEIDLRKETRGRPKRYNSDEERKTIQQKHALLHHYRKEALKNYLKTNPNADNITVKVNIKSKVLGSISEEIKYKRLPDGSYRKVQ